jgi:hypothetical protein
MAEERSYNFSEPIQFKKTASAKNTMNLQLSNLKTQVLKILASPLGNSVKVKCDMNCGRDAYFQEGETGIAVCEECWKVIDAVAVHCDRLCHCLLGSGKETFFRGEG